MHVSDLLSAHNLNLTLASKSTEAQLRRSIRRCAPTEHLDPTPFLEPNVLIITAGIGLNFRDSVVWEAYAERLARADVSAIVFAVGTAHPELPDELRMACNKYEIPLIAVSPDVPMLKINHYVDSMLQEEQFNRMNAGWALANECAHLANQGAELSTLLASVYTALKTPLAVYDAFGSVIAKYPEGVTWQESGGPSNQLLNNQLNTNELSLPLPMGLANPCRLVIKVVGTERADLEARIAPVASILALHLGKSTTSDAATVAEMRHFTEVCVGWSEATRLDVTKSFRDLGLSQQAETSLLVADMSGDNAMATWQIRLSLHNSFQDVRIAEFNDRLIALAQFPRESVENAEKILLRIDPPIPTVLRTATSSIDQLRLSLVHALDLVTHVERPTLAPDLGLSSVIAASAGRGARESAYSFLAPLIKHDEQKASLLMPTLRAWLKNDASPQRACEELFIHRNSLAYRLRKIEDLLRTDLSSIEGQSTCLMALKLIDVLPY